MKAFVINKDSDLMADLKKYNIQYTIWKPNKNSAIYKERSSLCKYLYCVKSTKRWIAHVTLWQHIAKNKLKNVLVLEDNTVLANNFVEKLANNWDHIKGGWDIVLLGCGGSCEGESTGTKIVGHVLGRVNEEENKICHPALPLGLYGYIISDYGAQRLLDSGIFDEIGLDIDYTFAREVACNDEFNVITFKQLLVYPNIDKYSDDVVDTHKIIDFLTGRVSISSQSSLQTVLNTKVLNYNPLKIPINVLTLLIIVCAFFVGLFSSGGVGFMVVLAVLTVLELAFFGEGEKYKGRALVFEFVMAAVFLAVGRRVAVIRGTGA
jgi:hypothetical protein